MSSQELRIKVQQLRDAELKLEDDLAASKIDLAAARGREADLILAAALNDGSGERAGKSPAEIAEHISSLTTAIGHARESRRGAIVLAWSAEAEDLRKQAVAQAEIADAHDAKTNELLEALRRHDGVKYWIDRRVFEEGDSGGMLFIAPDLSRSSKGEHLRRIPDDLERQAIAAENRQVSQVGDVNASSRGDLLEMIRSWDAWTIAPALHLVSDWMDTAETALDARIQRRPQALEGPAPVGRDQLEYAYHLVWRSGEIDARASSARAFYRRSERLIGRRDGLMAERIVNVA